MVYFHAIDFVLGRKEVDRKAWRAKCHLPRIMFVDKRKHRRGVRTSVKLFNYACFKRMVTVKSAVYERHKVLLRMYEKYCHQADISPYWADSEDDDQPTDTVVADDTNELDCTDGF